MVISQSDLWSLITFTSNYWLSPRSFWQIPVS